MSDPITLEWSFPRAVDTQWALPPAAPSPVAAFAGQRGLSAAKQLFDAGYITEPTAEALADYLAASEAAGEAALQEAQEAIALADAGALASSESAAASQAAADDAAAAAAQAELDRLAAATSASGAATSSSAASAILSAVQATGQIYADIETGRAAVADGATFAVQGAGETFVTVYRRTDASTQTLVGTAPSQEAYAALAAALAVDSTPGNLRFRLIDENRPWVSWDLGTLRGADGIFEVKGLDLGQSNVPTGSRFSSGISVGGVDVLLWDRRGWARFIPDEFTLTYIGDNLIGAGAIAAADLPDIGGRPASYGQRGSVNNTYWSDAYGPLLMFSRPAPGGRIIVKSSRQAESLGGNGQSLLIGGGATTNSSPNLTTVCPYQEMLFTLDDSKGTRGDVGTAANVATVGLKPAVEFFNGGDLGETIGTITMAALQEFRMQDGQPVVPMAYRCHGQGGRALADITVGTVNYENGLAYTERFDELFVAEGYDSSVMHGVDLVHGEQDTSIATPGATYYGGVEDLIDGYNTNIPEITGQTEPVYLFVSQLSADTATLSVGPIGQAQLDLCLTHPLAVYTAPRYILEHEYDAVAGTYDRLHLSARGTQLGAIYQAKARHLTQMAGAKWFPCHLIPADVAGAYTLTGSTLRWRCHVPVGPLRINRDLLALHPTLGFGFGDNAGAIALAGPITIENGDTLVFPLASTPGTGRYISAGYDEFATPNAGYVRAWTNISDSETRTSRFRPGLKLANYLASTRMTY